MGQPKILFIAEAGTLAHVARMVSLARMLPLNLYEVFFAAAPFYDTAIGAYPGTHIPIWSRSPADFLKIMNRGGVIFPEELLFRYVKDDRDIIRQVQPDLVIGDLRPSLSVSARSEGVPYMLISNANWCPAVIRSHIPFPVLELTHKIGLRGGWGRRFYSLLESLYQRSVPRILLAQCAGINAVRSHYRLPPYADYFSSFTDSDCTLYADLEMIFPHTPLPANHHFLGPVLWAPDLKASSLLSAIPVGKPLVYVNLGSSGDQRLLQRICFALVEMGVTVVAGGGHAAPGRGVFWEPILPGPDFLARASLAVTNGGSPTSYQALSMGVPVLGIPGNMDQLIFMRFLELAGGGISLRGDTVTPRDIRQAAETIFSQDSFRLVAAELQKLIVPDACRISFQQYVGQMVHEATSVYSAVGGRF